tara:strand:- start:3127 stop:3285 length:159 start_codon:yes stop_codon:yes gene_type:complete
MSKEEFNQEKFEEEIQRILDKFHFEGGVRREIFSQIIEYAHKQNKKITKNEQ